MSYADPNFTIVTSGGCNSFCSFCTDPFKRKASPDYLRNLENVLFSKLPDQYRSVSISGGEPTLSPDFGSILGLIKLSNRFDKVVLTTNGTKLKELLPLVIRGVNHVNISRHAIGYDANTEVFGTHDIISDDDLTYVAGVLNKHGIDVNLNHVYSETKILDVAYVHDFVEYAKSVGATSVSFRYDQNNNTLSETYLEKLFDSWLPVKVGACSVCRNHTILISGMPVVFKASYSEPSAAIDDVYELIYHINGKLTTDWASTNEFSDELKATYEHEYTTNPNKKHIPRDMGVTIPKIAPRSAKRAPIVLKPAPIETSAKSYGGGCGGAFGGGGCGS